MVSSQNGYPANDVDLTTVWRIPGTVRDVRLKRGDAGFLLVHFAAWFDKNVESIDNDGELDDWGYAPRPIRGSDTVSNHASGTALDLNAPEHPLGVRDTFTPVQRFRIRKKLEEYEGCIRWGGDYTYRVDEMHFEINKSLDEVSRVARKLRLGVEDMDPKEVWSSDSIKVPVVRASEEYRKKNPFFQARNAVSEIWSNSIISRQLARETAVRTRRIEAALKALSAGMPGTVREAVEDALEDTVIEVDINVNQGEEV